MLGSSLEILTGLVGKLVDLLLGFLQRGLGPGGPLSGAVLSRGLPAAHPPLARRSSEPAHDGITPSGTLSNCDDILICPYRTGSCARCRRCCWNQIPLVSSMTAAAASLRLAVTAPARWSPTAPPIADRPADRRLLAA